MCYTIQLRYADTLTGVETGVKLNKDLFVYNEDEKTE
jgi:hypothetical protein